jgi:hypothetical protein
MEQVENFNADYASGSIVSSSYKDVQTPGSSAANIDPNDNKIPNEQLEQL